MFLLTEMRVHCRQTGARKRECWNSGGSGSAGQPLRRALLAVVEGVEDEFHAG
jgi:hypothetical protein